MFEKKFFAISPVFEKMDYLILGDNTVLVFTDHKNLLLVFPPLAVLPNIGRHVVSNIQRWAMYLSRFQFTIEHIEGHRNVFEDILTRCGKVYRSEQKTIATEKHSLYYH